MSTENNYAATLYSEIENDAAVLEKNVMDYPSSSVARFLLLYHYKKNNDSRFEELAKQTAIYLHDPLWSQFQLSKADENGNIFPATEPTAKSNPDAESIKKEDIFIANEQEQNAINKEPFSPVNEQKSGNVIFDSPPSEEKATEAAEQTVNSESADPTELESTPDENNTGSFFATKEKTLEEDLAIEDVPPPVNEQTGENFILGIEPAEESKDERFEAEANQTNLAGEGLFLNTETDSNDDAFSENKQDTDSNPPPSTEKLADSPEKNEADESSYNNEAENNESETDDEDSELPFEPLHTVDYFASQGIKIPEEAFENDTLGKQVKSFTAWLKTMKKLHPGQLPEQNEVIERIIQTSSEVSNQNVNVLTEAMAEVLLKQGKQEKAIEMYQKLSLLNPSKSAYFAAKIESLKIV